MLSKIKKNITQTIAVALFLVPVASVVTTASAAPVAAPATPQVQQQLCQGSTLQFGTDASCEQNGTEATSKVNDLIAQIINIFSVIVGIVAVIMIIIGGFRYITSGGDSGNVTGAKNTILYAVIGLVIVALAQFLVKFVLSKVTIGGSST